MPSPPTPLFSPIPCKQTTQNPKKNRTPNRTWTWAEDPQLESRALFFVLMLPALACCETKVDSGKCAQHISRRACPGPECPLPPPSLPDQLSYSTVNTSVRCTTPVLSGCSSLSLLSSELTALMSVRLLSLL